MSEHQAHRDMSSEKHIISDPSFSIDSISLRSEEDRRGIRSHEKASSIESRSKIQKAHKFQRPSSRTGMII